MARFKNEEFDRIYQRISVIPDGPEREQLFFEAKRLMAAYAPYRFHVHRILTDLTWPWVSGFRRPPYWQTGGNTSISMLASRRRRSRHEVRLAAVAGRHLSSSALPVSWNARSKPRFFAMRFRSPKPASIRPRSPICIRAPSHHHIFDGLYRYDHLARPFKIKPNTAAAMPEVSDDFRVWTVKLRPGIYFQDDPAFKGQSAN